jgi:hypothetical protein
VALIQSAFSQMQLQSALRRLCGRSRRDGVALAGQGEKVLGAKLRKVEQLAEKFRKLEVDTEKERVSREDN